MADSRSSSPPDAGLPPASFVTMMDVPTAAYKTAIAVKHDDRMTHVEVSFILVGHDAEGATYHAQCPRCHDGQITVSVPLALDGNFAEAPACPTLCLACEDRLDAMLEPGPVEQPNDRAGLGRQIKAMTTRAWD